MRPNSVQTMLVPFPSHASGSAKQKFESREEYEKGGACQMLDLTLSI